MLTSWLSYSWILLDISIYTIFLIKVNIYNLLFNIFMLDGIIQAINFFYVWISHIYSKYKGLEDDNLNILSEFSKMNYSYQKYEPLEYIIDFAGKIKENFHNAEYKINVMDKYTYFFLIYLLNILTRLVLWNKFTALVDIICTILTMPCIYLIVCKLNFFIIIIDTIKEELYKLYLNISCRLTAIIINHLTYNVLESNPNVDSKELEDFYEGVFFKESIDVVLQFVKTIFVLSTVHYYKKTKNIVFRSVINLFYNIHVNGINLLSYRTNEQILNINKKKMYLSKIISERNWHILVKPKNIDLFFELYDDRKENTLISSLTKSFNFLSVESIKFFTLLTVLTNTSPLMKNNYINIILWVFGACLFNYNTFNLTHKKKSMLLSLILIFFDYNIIGSFFVLFGHLIIELAERLKCYIMKKKIIKVFKTFNTFAYFTIPLFMLSEYSIILILCSTAIYLTVNINASKKKGITLRDTVQTYYQYIKIENAIYLAKLYYSELIKEIYSEQFSYKKYYLISFFTIGYLSSYNILHLIIMNYIYTITLNSIAILQKTLELEESNMLNLLYVSNYMAQSMHKSLLEKSKIFELHECEEEDQIKYQNFKIKLYPSYFNK